MHVDNVSDLNILRKRSEYLAQIYFIFISAVAVELRRFLANHYH